MDIKPVLLACYQLHQEGKQISIALIKRKLTTPLPLAYMVRGKTHFAENKAQVIKMFEQENGQKTTSNNFESEDNEEISQPQQCNSCEQLIAENAFLQQTIKALQAEVKALKKA